MRRTCAGLWLAGLLLFAPSAQAVDPVGALTQLPGIDGCWSLQGASEDGADTCHGGAGALPGTFESRGLDQPYALAVTPGGTNVYANIDHGIAIFERGPASGVIHQLGPAPGFVAPEGCITFNGQSVDAPVPGACNNGRAVNTTDYGRNIVVSPDERFVYMAAADSNAIVVFSRDNAHGKLTQLAGADGCVTMNGSSEDGAGTCQDGRHVDSINGLALSPDGKTLYGASTNDGFVIFSVDTVTGKLTQLAGTQGCVTSGGASSDDGPGTCTDAKGVNYSNEIVVSPDGRNVYTVGYAEDTVAAFSRDPTTGAVTQLAGLDGCISRNGSSNEGAGTCTDGVGLDGPFGLDVSRDGKNVYAGLYDAYGIASFNRDATTGKLTQLTGLAGCITADGSSSDGAGTCADGRAGTQPYDVTVAPDGLNVYAGNYANTGAITAFRRDPASGALAQLAGVLGCYTPDGESDDDGVGTCRDIRGGEGSGPMAISPDGAFLYAPGFDDDTIVILSRQIPPSCKDSTATTRSNKAVTVPLTCTDANGDPVTLAIGNQPGHGTLGSIDQTANTVVYTPAKDFSGTDRFTFAATDGGELPSNTATADITVRDTVATRCTVRTKRARLKKLAKGAAIFKLRCKEAGTAFAELLAKRKAAGVLGLLTKVKRTKIGAGKKKATKAGVVRVKVKVRRLARQGLRKLSLRQARRLKLALRVRFVDSAGNRSGRKTKKLKLRR